MFIESVRVSCSFPTCGGGSANYQTCLTDPPQFLT